MQSGMEAIGQNRPEVACQAARSTPVWTAIIEISLDVASRHSMSSGSFMPPVNDGLQEIQGLLRLVRIEDAVPPAIPHGPWTTPSASS